MSGRRRIVVAAVLAGPGLAAAGSWPTAAEPVVIGAESRVSMSEAARRLGIGTTGIADRFGATGMIECGGMRSTGQLTGRGDRVTTAAHALYDDAGRSRAERGACRFTVTIGGVTRTVDIRPDPALCGSTTPYGKAGHHDWAVARLDRPLSGVRPYGLGAPPAIGQTILVVSHPHGPERVVDLCRVRAVLARDDGGPREIRTDCTGRGGMSGAAYLTAEPDPKLLGIHVGFRSASPGAAAAFSDRHHTFGAAVESGFRTAIVR